MAKKLERSSSSVVFVIRANGITRSELSKNSFRGNLKFRTFLDKRYAIKVTRSSATNCENAVAFSAKRGMKKIFIARLDDIPMSESVTIFLSFLWTLNIRSTKI